MEEYIRQLPHDNQQLEKQWPEIFDKLQKLSRDISEDVKVKSLDALVDYVIADNEEFVQIKATFIEITIKKFIDDPLPSLNELVRIFCRILEISNADNLLQLTFLQQIYRQFRLAERLSKPLSIDLINQILISLQKHEFLNKNFNEKNLKKWSEFISQSMFSMISSDRNKLNYEETMNTMRSDFQQLYR